MEDWIQTLVMTHGKAIYNFCFYLTGSRDAADDLYQDTFLTAIEKESTLLSFFSNETNNTKEENQKQLKNYLLGIAIRLFKYKKRKQQWRNHIIPMDETEDALLNVKANGLSPEEQYLRTERCHKIRQLIWQLPDKLRLAVILYYIEEKSTEEIATYLNISASSVRSRLHRARKYLKKELEEMNHEI